MTIQFQQRNGMKFTVKVTEDIGHAVVGLVVKGRKPFAGKHIVFAKNDMANLKTVEA